MANDAPTAITRHTPRTEGIQAFQPANFGELQALAELLSASGMVPDALKGKPADIATIILHGASLRIDAMASLRSIHCIKGKPVLSADLAVAVCLRESSVCQSFVKVESTDTIATFETVRVGQAPVRLSFTIEQAKTAGLTGDNWKKYPAAMLRARCIAALSRMVYPDLLAGVYEPDELAPQAAPVERDVTPEPVRAVARIEAAPSVTAQPEQPAPTVTDVPTELVAGLVAEFKAATSVRDLGPIAARLKASGIAGAAREEAARVYLDRKRELTNGGAL